MDTGEATPMEWALLFLELTELLREGGHLPPIEEVEPEPPPARVLRLLPSVSGSEGTCR
jgi:hypothetical protein